MKRNHEFLSSDCNFGVNNRNPIDFFAPLTFSIPSEREVFLAHPEDAEQHGYPTIRCERPFTVSRSTENKEMPIVHKATHLTNEGNTVAQTDGQGDSQRRPAGRTKAGKRRKLDVAGRGTQTHSDTGGQARAICRARL